jgi:hypothetical protein
MTSQCSGSRCGAFWISSARDRMPYSTMSACVAMANSLRHSVRRNNPFRSPKLIRQPITAHSWRDLYRRLERLAMQTHWPMESQVSRPCPQASRHSPTRLSDTSIWMPVSTSLVERTKSHRLGTHAATRNRRGALSCSNRLVKKGSLRNVEPHPAHQNTRFNHSSR